jgi:polyisoprenoid-binding protein YceI
MGVTTQSGRFNKADGTVMLDFDARNGSIFYEIDTRSLNMGYGTENIDSPGYRLFDVGHFPKITFKSSKLYFGENNKIIAADGQLSLLGVTRPLTVKVNHFQCSMSRMMNRTMCTADVTATVIRSEFGMLDFIPSISDEVNIYIPVEAYKD